MPCQQRVQKANICTASDPTVDLVLRSSSLIFRAPDALGTHSSKQRVCPWRPTGTRASMVAVPTISRFCGIVIAMYFDDHGFPHFHARHAGASAKVRFDQIDVIESNLEVRQLRLVLAWAELHRDELLENWRRARAGERLLEIEPLR
jgi:hypothetical protein